MEVILYAAETSKAGERLEKAIKTSSGGLDIQVYRTMRSLTQKLRQLKVSSCIAVLLAHSKESLTKIISIKDLFWNIPIILILPDNEMKTISRGHGLYPRFLSYIDSDFKDVATVLFKMIDKYKVDYFT